MKSRERVIRAIEFKMPDRIPLFHGPLAATRWKYGKKLQEIFIHFPNDIIDLSVYQTHLLGREDPRVQKGKYIDEWGVLWENLQEGICGQPKVHPLSEWKSLNTYKFPEPLEVTAEYSLFDLVEEFLRKSKHEKYTIVWEVGSFHRIHFLRGLNNLLIDLYKRTMELKLLQERIIEYNIKRIKKWIEIGIDGIMFSWDVGTQKGLMISPKIWREFFKPEVKRYSDVLHKAGKHHFWHSDGDVIDIIPDLIDCKVDVLFIQLTNMLPRMTINDLEKFTGKVCFMTDLDRQHVLPFGTVEEVRQLVKHVIKTLGTSDGGLIGGAEVGPDVPLANIKAIYETFYYTRVLSS